MFALLRQRNFALLWSGGLISRTGDWLLDIGLSFYVYTVTGSALATSIALLAAFVPGLLLGSFAGVFVDRWDRRWTMIVSNLVLALGLLPLLAVHSRGTIWIAYIVLFFEACVAQFVTPAQNALVPVLVDEERLVSANALQSIGQETPRLPGGALGGVLVGFVGLYSVTLLDAISFLAVCVMIWLIKMPAQPQSRPAEAQEANAATSLAVAVKSFGREWLEGMQLILDQYLLVVLFIIIAVQSLGEGVFGVLLIVFVKLVLHSGAAIYGSLMSFQVAGNLAGALGDRLGPTLLLNIQGGGYALSGVFAIIMLWKVAGKKPAVRVEDEEKLRA